jgi:hypothetical protein
MRGLTFGGFSRRPSSSKIFFKSGFKVAKLTGPRLLGAFSKMSNLSATSLIAGF